MVTPVWADYVSGSLAITLGAISAGSTQTMTSSGLSTLPSCVDGVSRAKLTLDPFGVNGLPELVYVTSHAAGTTTATIQRIAGQPLRQHNASETWVHGPTAEDFVEFQGQLDNQFHTSLFVAKGDFLAATAGNTPARHAVGADYFPLVALSTQPDNLIFQQLTGAGIAAASIVSAHIVDGTIVAVDLATGAVTTVKLADGAVDHSKIDQTLLSSVDQHTAFFTATHDLTGASFTDVPGSALSVTVPAWATRAVVTAALAGASSVTSTASTQLQTWFGGVTGAVRTLTTSGTGGNEGASWSDLIVGIPSGAQTIKVRATRVTGTGALRIQTASTIDYGIVYLP